MNAQDYLLDDDGDLKIVNGDFVIGDSDLQNINDILISEQGWWKEFPALGAGISKLLKGKVIPTLVESLIKAQLESDGFQVGRPSVTNAGGNVTISPNAKRINL
jgi:hypothetical protein